MGVCNFDSDKLRQFHSLMAARDIPVVSNQVPLLVINIAGDACTGQTPNCMYAVALYRPLLKQRAAIKYSRQGIAFSQVKYSVFDRGPEKSGLLQACKDLGVTLIAHSPLQRGLLTGEVASESSICRAAKLHQPACASMSVSLRRSGSFWTGRALEEGSEKLSKDQQTVLKLLQFIGAMSGGKTVTQVALSYLMSKGAQHLLNCTDSVLHWGISAITHCWMAHHAI